MNYPTQSLQPFCEVHATVIFLTPYEARISRSSLPGSGSPSSDGAGLRALESVPIVLCFWDFRWLRNPPASAGEARDAGLIPGSGR